MVDILDEKVDECLPNRVVHYSLHTIGSTKTAIIQTRGGHLYVTCWSVCNKDQDFWLAKSVLDCLTVPLKALDRLIFYRSKFELELHVLDVLIFVVGLPWSCDRLSKGFDLLIQFWSLSQTLLLHGTYKRLRFHRVAGCPPFEGRLKYWMTVGIFEIVHYIVGVCCRGVSIKQGSTGCL